jgi:hypothetical protein
VGWLVRARLPAGQGADETPGTMHQPEPIYARNKGEKHEVIATYDAEFRAGFDRKIIDCCGLRAGSEQIAAERLIAEPTRPDEPSHRRRRAPRTAARRK